jgi:hypothetical protein
VASNIEHYTIAHNSGPLFHDKTQVIFLLSPPPLESFPLLLGALAPSSWPSLPPAPPPANGPNQLVAVNKIKNYLCYIAAGTPSYYYLSLQLLIGEKAKKNLAKKFCESISTYYCSQNSKMNYNRHPLTFQIANFVTQQQKILMKN